jgi:EAL domain-containing protein (putative c-di-GMP-specific phosphodiesterase class I)
LEITESIATYDADYIISTLNKLKALGVTISIDDFGTEYSSLSRLKIMPVDKIKIDMRFIQGIYRGSKDESIIKVMLQLGRTFGLKVLAEGVENEQQLSFLKENLCDEIQGYYFYKPMTAEELEPILTHTKS